MNGAARSNVRPHREYLESSLNLEGEDAANAVQEAMTSFTEEGAR